MNPIGGNYDSNTIQNSISNTSKGAGNGSAFKATSTSGKTSVAVAPVNQTIRNSSYQMIVPANQRGAALSESFDEKTLKQVGAIECQTCSTRTYQDSSSDPSVSFQSPTHISPESAGAQVMAHEQEHVVNDRAAAESEGREVISQSVQIFTSICPECGKSYVSGGLTTTTSANQKAAYSPINDTNREGNLLDIKL